MSEPQPILFVGGPKDDDLMMVQPSILETGAIKFPVSDGGSMNYLIVRALNVAVPDTWKILSMSIILDLRKDCVTDVVGVMMSKLMHAGADERTVYATLSPIYDEYFVEALATGFAE